MGKNGINGALLILLCGVVWSFGGVLNKWIPWSAFSIIGGRSILAALIFGLYRGSFKPRFTRGTWLGGLGVMVTSALFIIATKLTSAANAIVLQYAMPIVVIFASWVIYKQKPKRLDVTASLIVLFGILLCFLGGLGGGSLLGDALALLSAFTFAVVFFAARMPDTDPADYTYLGSLLNCVFLLFIPFDKGFTATPAAFLGILAAGLCLSGGYLLFTAGMRKQVSPVTASIMTNIEPILSPVWVFLFLGENPGPLSLLGSLLVIVTISVYGIMKSKALNRPAPMREGVSG
jgi:drug/metabolite transporter (DMT)-like permease